MDKTLKYFMTTTEDEIITVPGLERFKDENSETVPFEVKVLSRSEIDSIYDKYTKRSLATDKKGNPIVHGGEVVWKSERDNNRAARHVIVEALQYPNLKDPELMEYYNCIDVTDMPLKVFGRADEYDQVVRTVFRALGLMESFDNDDEDEIEAAKN